MHKILIVEDNEEQRTFLVNCIQSLSKDYQTFDTAFASDALEIVSNNNVDLIFLDIRLPDCSGLELAKKIRQIQRYELTWIVFLTSYSDYILEAFQQIHCYDYITKPYEPKQIAELVQRLTKPTAPLTVIHQEFISFQMKGYILKINLKDILFFEIFNKNCTIHTKNQPYMVKKTTLKKILDMLNSDCFIQSHRSYAVNLTYVEKITKIQNSYEISFSGYPNKALLGDSFKTLLMNKLGIRSDI